MARPRSKIAPGWWDYTTLPEELLTDAAALTPRDMAKLARPGFAVRFFDTLEEFYLAEALEYITAWQQSSADNPAGLCGPIGPTEQLPLVARLVNDLNICLKDAHFWGMDEWVDNGQPVDMDHPLSFARADMELCFDRVDRSLAMPRENIHFPVGDLDAFSRSFRDIRCVLMQGGQGEVKHWAFNDPLRRDGRYADEPPTPEQYRRLGARVVELHPVTIMQNARTSGGGNLSLVPTHAATVGPLETWQAETVSIWHAGTHDNAFGMRLTTLMLGTGTMDSSVPMSLLADHPDVRFNFFRGGVGHTAVAMH